MPPCALSLKISLLYFSLTHLQFPPLEDIIVPDLYSSALLLQSEAYHST